MTEQKKTKHYTPQQIKFAMAYYLPDSPTFSNAYQSALKAGYTENTAKNIITQDFNWVKEIYMDLYGDGVTKAKLVKKAKRVADKALDSSDEKIASSMSQFVLKTDPEFSEKQDITSKGENINPMHGLTVEELKKLAKGE